MWDIAKWPVLIILISLLFALLYWAGPNAKRTGGFRWISPGSVLAVILWIVASAGFTVYVANFSSYNKIYGSLAAVIVFLIWLWISNLAILFGAEFDAEMQRGRAIAGGHPIEEEPFSELRDDRKLRKKEKAAARPGGTVGRRRGRQAASLGRRAAPARLWPVGRRPYPCSCCILRKTRQLRIPRWPYAPVVAVRASQACYRHGPIYKARRP